MDKKVIKIKVGNFKTSSVNTGAEGIFEAYVSIFGNVDSYGEVVDKGAFAESIMRKFPKIAWSHKWDEIIGTVLEAREDNRGLYIKGQLTSGVQRADEALKLMLAGAVTEFSIGYRVREDYIGTDNFRHLKTIDLYEVSPVLVGANPDTELLSVKSVQTEDSVEPEMQDHVVTQEDLDENPVLVENGVQIGETIQVPVPQEREEVEIEDEAEEEAPAEQEPEPKATEPQEAEKGEKAGRVLSEANRTLITQTITEIEALGAQLKDLVIPLNELLTATEGKGGKVEPIAQDSKTVLRIRQSAKQAEKSLNFIIRATR